MKKIIIALFAALSFISCSKDEVIPEPTVSFTAKQNGEGNITFNISTANAETFSWDFGDGGKSTERLPTYTYSENGVYNVTVSAKGKGGEVVKTGKITIDDVTGSVIFWMQSMKNKELEVYVDGKYAGRITGYYATGNAPECGGQNSATLTRLKEGTHQFTAKELNAIFPVEWSGNIKVVGRKCTKQQLQYK